MLIIGDAAIKELKPDHKVNNIEIIGYQNQFYYIENILNTPIERENLNRYTRLYNIKNNKNLYLYGSNEVNVLRTLLDDNFANKWDFVFAPPKLLYCLELLKVTERFNNINDWENAVLNYNYIFKTYILPMKNHNENILRELDMFSTKLYFFITGSNLINDKYYTLRKFDIYLEDDLHNIFQYNKKFNFLDVGYGDGKHEIRKTVWKTFTLEDKIRCVLERAYVLAINDFIIPYWLDNKSMPKNTDELFKKALMIIVSTTNSQSFSMFIVNHYNIILSKFNRYYVNIFSNAIKHGDIEEIK